MHLHDRSAGSSCSVSRLARGERTPFRDSLAGSVWCCGLRGPCPSPQQYRDVHSRSEAPGNALFSPISARTEVSSRCPTECRIGSVQVCGTGSGPAMKVDELVSAASQRLSVSQVFGEPHQDGGVTVIPAAKIMGGAGGGGGEDSDGQSGEGGGFGVIARPTGAYVIRDGEVRWVPAFDLNRAIVLGCVLLLAGFRLGRRGLRSSRR